MHTEPLTKKKFLDWIDFEQNPYHPFVWIRGEPEIGENVYLGFFSVINAKASSIEIGDNCDIAPMVMINCADSHRKCLGLTNEVDRTPIKLEHNVFVGGGAIIKPGSEVGHHTVVGAGETVSGRIPPYSLVVDGTVNKGYYQTAVRNA